MNQTEVYLGDGVYASDDGFMIKLATPKQYPVNEIWLEQEVLQKLFDYIECQRNVRIRVTQRSSTPGPNEEYDGSLEKYE